MTTSRLNIKLVLIILTALMVLQGYLFYQFVQDFQQTRFWLGHTYDVIFDLKTLSADIKQNKLENIELIVTGNKNVLNNEHNVFLKLENLKALTADNAVQQNNMHPLEKLIIKQLDFLDSAIKNFSNLPPDQVLKILFSPSVIATDTAINNIIVTMIAEEEKLLAIRIKDNQVAKDRFYHFNAIAGIASYIILIALIIILMRNLNKQKRLALQRTAADIKFKKLFELSSDAHLLYDKTGIIDCNEAVLKMLRCYQKSQLVGMHPAEFSANTQPDGKTAEAKKLEIEKQTREHGFYSFEWLLRRFDGVEIPIEVSITQILLEDKEIFLVVWHDISEQKKYQNMLEQLHKINSSRTTSLDKRIHKILLLGCQYFHLPNGILGKVDDDNYQVLYCNTTDHGLLPGTNLPLSANAKQLFNVRFLLALEDVGSKEITFQQFPIKSYIGCSVYVNGQPFANLGFFKSKPRTEEFSETEKTFVHLISEWISKEIETDLTLKELAVSKERLERAIKSSNDGLWEWNCVTNKVYVNPRYKEILGYQENELGDDLESLTDLIHPDDINAVWSAITESFEQNKHFNVEFRFHKKDGNYVWVLSRGDVFRDQSGKPVLMTGFITDIQALKEKDTKAS